MAWTVGRNQSPKKLLNLLCMTFYLINISTDHSTKETVDLKKKRTWSLQNWRKIIYTELPMENFSAFTKQAFQS